MSTDIESYVELKRIVSYFLDQYNKSEADFDKAWVLAFRGLVKLGFTVTFEPKSIAIPINPNKTVNFPSDYVSWTKIGILNNKGEVSTLKINNGLSIMKDLNPNRLGSLSPQVSDSVPLVLGSSLFLNYFYNGSYFNLFGIGGGLIQYGECRIDEKNKVIVLSPDFQYDHIILEYLSSPEQDEDYRIQIQFQEALIAFIAWKMKLAAPQEYYGEVIDGRRSMNGKKVTLATINQVLREATGQYLKA